MSRSITPAEASMFLVRVAYDFSDGHECETDWCKATDDSDCAFFATLERASDAINELIPPAAVPSDWPAFYAEIGTD